MVRLPVSCKLVCRGCSRRSRRRRRLREDRPRSRCKPPHSGTGASSFLRRMLRRSSHPAPPGQQGDQECPGAGGTWRIFDISLHKFKATTGTATVLSLCPKTVNACPCPFSHGRYVHRTNQSPKSESNLEQNACFDNNPNPSSDHMKLRGTVQTPQVFRHRDLQTKDTM